MPTHREYDLENAPNKYDLTIHAEINAVINCSKKPVNGIAYVSCICCPPCLIHMYQIGIRQIHMINRTAKMLNERTEKVFDFIIEKSKQSKYGQLEIFVVTPSLYWLETLAKEVKEMREDGILYND